jgi:hypothetical protein
MATTRIRRGPIRVKATIKDTDHGYRDLMRRVQQARGAAVSVGITSESGEKAHDEAEGMTVLDIGAIHEFGIGVPERSFIRGWFDAFRDQARKLIKAAMEAVVAGKLTKAQALDMVGVRLQGECQKNMTTAPFEPLKRATILRKGSSKPLIDTGQLRSSITYKVEDK